MKKTEILIVLQHKRMKVTIQKAIAPGDHRFVVFLAAIIFRKYPLSKSFILLGVIHTDALCIFLKFSMRYQSFMRNYLIPFDP